MADIDISYWQSKKIVEVARELLKKISGKADWRWEVEFHGNPDDESHTLDHWRLTGKSKRHGLEIMMYLGCVPWTTVWKLHFTKDGNNYSCLTERFKKIPALKNLEIALDKIGRRTKEEQDKQKRQRQKNESRYWRRAEKRRAEILITSLRR